MSPIEVITPVLESFFAGFLIATFICLIVYQHYK